MTQGVYQFPSEHIDFSSQIDRLPPENIEAEEAVLGGLMLDPEAIYRVVDRLKPQHFYTSAHKDIYQAIIRLHKKKQPHDLLHVTAWLTEHGTLKRIGGRNKLATLVDRTVSSVNIDSLAGLVIKHAVRRDLIKLGNDILSLGYATHVEIEEAIQTVSKKYQSIVENPSFLTQEESDRSQYNRLVQQLKIINTTIPDPGYRAFKLQLLAEAYQKSIRFLDNLYAKTLASQTSALLDYEGLKAAAGKSLREWLLNGLIPKKTTIVLYADGGIGKTKFVYSIAKNLINGKSWGKFLPTGEKRRILIYQGDETEADMLQALETMGYGDSDIKQYIRFRFNWSFENMPLLIQDLNEFKPDLVVIDSLTHANRMSVYRENEVEYCRPLLEVTGLSNQHNCTFLIVHHSNKEGDIRGATSIRNSVSEVWKIEKDNSPQATPDDRFLVINKSRSRSSGNKYRMYFNSEDLTFTFLGEELPQEESGAEQNAKDRILSFFDKNRNTLYTAEELSHFLSLASGYARRSLVTLANDGLISRKIRPGKASLYYLSYDNADPQTNELISVDHHVSKPEIVDLIKVLDDGKSSIKTKSQNVDHPETEAKTLDTKGVTANDTQSIKKEGSARITIKDHLSIPDTASDTAEGDPLSTEKIDKKIENRKKMSEFLGSEDHLCPKPSPHKNPGGDPQGDPSVILGDPQLSVPESDDSPRTLHSNDLEVNSQGDPQGDPSSPKGYEKVKAVTNCNNISDSPPQNQQLESKFPIGKWVRSNGDLAQITGYFENRLFLNGQDRSSLFGNYDTKGCQLLTQLEMLELGLSVKLTGVDLNKTPNFVEGCYYWSNSLNERVKLSQLFEGTAANFKKPEALVIPGKGAPTRLALDDLRACHDSPGCTLSPKDVVVVCTGYRRKEPVAELGAVFKLDSQWVWVQLLKNGNLSSPQKFYAHRVVKAED